MPAPHVTVYITGHDTATDATLTALVAAGIPYLLVDATDPDTATQLWHEGWREAFVHCTGMYSRLRHVPEFRDVSHFSRILLERASLEIQVRVQQAADKLADFDFADMWPMQSVLPPPARDSFDRFRRFLSRHYEAVFWSWPPLPRFGTAEIWLTREGRTRLLMAAASAASPFVSGIFDAAAVACDADVDVDGAMSTNV